MSTSNSLSTNGLYGQYKFEYNFITFSLFQNSHTQTAGMAEEISPQQRQIADYLIPIFIAAILLSIPFVICVTSTCRSHRTITRTNRTTYTHTTLPVPRHHNPRRTDQGLGAQLFDPPPPLYGHHHQDIELDPMEPQIGSVSPSVGATEGIARPSPVYRMFSPNSV